MSEQTTEKENRAESQARCQLNSIKEMVAALTIEGAAWAYVEGLDVETRHKLLTEAEIEFDAAPAYVDDVIETLADAIADETIEPSDFEFDEDEARDRINEDPLSIEVRGGWHCPGMEDDNKPVEFKILLCTGGPACQIIGDLSEYGDPESARLQFQDWFEPWRELHIDSDEEEEILLKYCQQFYWGE